jgi:hypothetical protein
MFIMTLMLSMLLVKLFTDRFYVFIQDEPQTTLAGLLTTSGYSNDITKNGSSGDLKAASLRESRGKIEMEFLFTRDKHLNGNFQDGALVVDR